MLFVYEQMCMDYHSFVNGCRMSRIRQGDQDNGVLMSQPDQSKAAPDGLDPDVVPEASDYSLDGQIGFVLRRAHQRATAIFQEHFSDLTPTQWAVLSKLHEGGPLSQNLLGRMTAMDAATMQGVVRRLMERGLVSRDSDPNDRRRLTLCLTEAGRETVLSSTDKAFAVSRETLSPLNPRERATLLRLLSRLI